MSEYWIRYRKKGAKRDTDCFLGFDRTIDDYENRCRELVGEGHEDVRLVKFVVTEQVVKRFGEVADG